MSKPMKLLIGYDGSTCGDAALDDLRRTGLPDEANATVLTVADVMGPPVGDDQVIPSHATEDWYPAGMEEVRSVSTELVEQAATLAFTARKRLEADFPTWQVTDDVCAGSPASCILHKAQLRQADLIVVGSHSRSMVGRLFLGSVSQTIVTQSHTSVRVARVRHAAEDKPLSILIGVDGSATSELVMSVVAERNWPQGTRIQLVAAVDPMLVTMLAATAPAAAIQPSAFPDTTARIHNMLEVEMENIHSRNPGMEVAILIEQGDPKHVLLQAAEDWEADCIFVGARGQSRWQRLMLGSVSAAITARAHCSVEVVRPHEAAEQKETADD